MEERIAGPAAAAYRRRIVWSALAVSLLWGRDARPSAITGTVFDTMLRTTTCPQ